MTVPSNITIVPLPPKCLELIPQATGYDMLMPRTPSIAVRLST